MGTNVLEEHVASITRVQEDKIGHNMEKGGQGMGL
jgi:hypothetical protein